MSPTKSFPSALLMISLLVIAVSCAPSKDESNQTNSATESTASTAKDTTSIARVDPNAAPGSPEIVSDPISNPMMAEWSKLDGYKIACGSSTLNLAIPVNEIATNISRDSLKYDVEPFSDCSGVFHRVLDSLEKRCPSHSFPDPAKYRDSRGLARWYYEKNNLVMIHDPLASGSLIKPGAVLFYGGRKDTTIKGAFTIDDIAKQGGINHVGVVVKVLKDDAGQVTGYHLFHGQRHGKLASTTKYHKRKYKNRSEYPPYGNGSERLLAIGQLVAGTEAVVAQE